jgi:hypothetical protein
MTELAEAFGLLHNFKERRVERGQAMSEKEVALVRLLAEDLLPGPVPSAVDDSNIEQLLFDIADSDAKWNRALQDALQAFYSLQEKGDRSKAREVVERFVQSCPSSWYRSHATAALGK